MIGIISLLIGLLIVLISVFLIRREFVSANREQKRAFNSLSDENVNQVMQYLKKIEKELDDLNAAYYEIVSDLEGKYSVHDKEIELLQERLEAIQLPKPVKTYKMKNNTAGSQSVTDRFEPEVVLDEQTKICQEAVRLKQNGRTMSQIARELNMGIGELQLLLKTKG